MKFEYSIIKVKSIYKKKSFIQVSFQKNYDLSKNSIFLFFVFSLRF